jgi:hypothetical protein
MISSRLKYITTPICIFLILLALPTWVDCKKNGGSAAPASAEEHEPTIEEVSSKQLEKMLLDKDYVAVYWCKSTVTSSPLPPSSSSSSSQSKKIKKNK